MAFSLTCAYGMTTFILPERLFGIWDMTLVLASGSEPWTSTISAVWWPMSGMGWMETLDVSLPDCREPVAA